MFPFFSKPESLLQSALSFQEGAALPTASIIRFVSFPFSSFLDIYFHSNPTDRELQSQPIVDPFIRAILPDQYSVSARHTFRSSAHGKLVEIRFH